MTAKEKKAYAKIVAELRAMSARLKFLADAGYSDMEGADMPEFSISEELWGLAPHCPRLEASASRIETLLK